MYKYSNDVNNNNKKHDVKATRNIATTDRKVTRKRKGKINDAGIKQCVATGNMTDRRRETEIGTERNRQTYIDK